MNGEKRARWKHPCRARSDHLPAASDLMQYARNHLIEDLNPVERSDTKYHESYPRYLEKYPSLAALNATYTPKPSTRSTHRSHQCPPVVKPTLGNHWQMKERWRVDAYGGGAAATSLPNVELLTEPPGQGCRGLAFEGPARRPDRVVDRWSPTPAASSRADPCTGSKFPLGEAGSTSSSGRPPTSWPRADLCLLPGCRFGACSELTTTTHAHSVVTVC